MSHPQDRLLLQKESTMKNLFTSTIKQNDYKRLCQALYSAESEREVIDILHSYSLWEDDSYWTNYGQEDNNVAIIGNQTTSPEAALVEKFTNSIDAILIKEAKLRGIDPKAKEAPQSIDEAMKLFFGNREEELKSQIYMVATGSQKHPCLAIIDKGEGQTPAMLGETILSLRKTNKIEIKFVQGQFNQGGTAVLPFCGTNRFQLVISKRNQDIADTTEDDSHLWGFTIVRRNSLDEQSRNTRYEYLTIDGEVPSFEAASLDLLPAKYPKARSEKLESGTYIKLYEYNLSINSHIHMTLNYHLSLLLPGAKIPINLMERREWEFKNRKSIPSMTARMYGHFTQFTQSKKGLESGFPFVFPMEVDGEKLTITLLCFSNNSFKKNKRTEGVLFTLNGQTQGILKDTFFDRKRVALGYLKESLLVFVDCSNLSVKYREDLFMSNRQHLRNNSFKRKIEKLLEDELSQNKMLQKLQKRRRKELMQEQINNSKGMQKTLSKLLKISPNLNMLFETGKDFEDKIHPADDGKNLFNFQGEEFPSFFKLDTKKEQYPKECPQNRNFRIAFLSDVEDNYFTREFYQGDAQFWIGEQEVLDYTLTLKDGKAYFTSILPQENQVGEKLSYRYIISNKERQEISFYGEFEVLVTPEVDKEEKQKEEKKPPKKESALEIPQIQEVYRDEWERYDFSEEDIISIKANAQSYDFFINMDNRYLEQERKNSKDDALRLNEIFKGAIFLYALSLLGDKKEDDMQKIQRSIHSYAKVTLPIFQYAQLYKV